MFLLCVIRKKWRDKTLNVTTRKKKRKKVWYREFSRISNIGIAIIEKWIAFRDRDALNSNPATAVVFARNVMQGMHYFYYVFFSPCCNATYPNRDEKPAFATLTEMFPYLINT